MKRTLPICAILASISIAVLVLAESGTEDESLGERAKSFTGGEIESSASPAASDMNLDALSRRTLSEIGLSPQLTMGFAGVIRVPIPDSIRQHRHATASTRDLLEHEFKVYIDSSSGSFVAAVSGTLVSQPRFDTAKWIGLIRTSVPEKTIELTLSSTPPQIPLIKLLQNSHYSSMLAADYFVALYVRAVWIGPPESRSLFLSADTACCWIIACAFPLDSERVPTYGQLAWTYQVKAIEATSGIEFFDGYVRPQDPSRGPHKVSKQK